MEMKNVIISIKGSRRDANGVDSSMEFVTDGMFYHNNGISVFCYNESDLTGMKGTTTSFTTSPAGSITMTREGAMNTRMVFEEGKKHCFIYDTPFGSTSMGVNTKKASFELNEHGGHMEVDYFVDYQHSVIGHNIFKIDVRELKEDL